MRRWTDAEPKDLPKCSLCKGPMTARSRIHAKDSPACSMHLAGVGYLEVLALFCLKCDQH